MKNKKISLILRNYVEDIFIGAGAAAINLATFFLHPIAGLYCFGVTLLAFGLMIARHPPRRR